MASYTENYGLHQWVPEDDFLRTDFNQDFQKIDTALSEIATGVDDRLAQKPEIVKGSYVGSGDTQKISLGFAPKAVLVAVRSFYMALGTTAAGNRYVKLNDSGFQVDENTNNMGTNDDGDIYYYLAIK